MALVQTSAPGTNPPAQTGLPFGLKLEDLPYFIAVGFAIGFALRSKPKRSKRRKRR